MVERCKENCWWLPSGSSKATRQPCIGCLLTTQPRFSSRPSLVLALIYQRLRKVVYLISHGTPGVTSFGQWQNLSPLLRRFVVIEAAARVSSLALRLIWESNDGPKQILSLSQEIDLSHRTAKQLMALCEQPDGQPQTPWYAKSIST